MECGSDELDDKNGLKVPNMKLTQIVNEVPKQEIVYRVLDHLGLKDEKIYDLDIYLQKLSYVFTETLLSGKGQINIIEALEQAQLKYVNYLLNQENLDENEFAVDAFQKYDDVNIKLVAGNDPYQLELTEESLLLDYFMKYIEKNSHQNQQVQMKKSDDDQESEETEQTDQVDVEEIDFKDIVKTQLSRQITHFQRRFNPHASVLDKQDDEEEEDE